MKRYVGIAYKPNSCSSVRNCVQERFSSDFAYESFDTQSEIIEWGALKLAYDNKWGEAGYELTILVDGETWTDDDAPETIMTKAEDRAKTIIRDRKLVAKLSGVSNVY